MMLMATVVDNDDDLLVLKTTGVKMLIFQEAVAQGRGGVVVKTATAAVDDD
ncbi:hypothetical protein HanRHA438_Chr07g0298141 [Helianthus annuus]|uniref:Uncharacterized protein n=1 Tax=Helianthus annuus TaxID=4232 RepID=A0A251UKI2_HELAN|nr:hypothetical protein HanXRQr2_Chr07g0287481 [Helianthus annuus]KAJ0549664.1 hypothetical protein HanHA300_Chr07g0236411 [Helianthus annuus]KAJ0556134.1 hypothetical protein HanIR_Chr07g0310241 [Helianthus annuus]KAJ0562619.1 hypothetical protein HanHA89_Chr07g0253591 [Helianthus annuus]KAJ0727994.1 hypothetical protein HanLR1_Chr07g0236351 [Helianthus annuus]